MRLAAHRHALPLLGIISFVESSFFPIPPDVMLVPMVLANRAKALLIALVATVGSVLGGVAGYAIGYFLFEAVGTRILEFYGYSHEFEALRAQFNEYGIWLVIAAGLTPLPYKVFTIASGVAGLALPVFLLGSIVSRGLRFFAEAILLWWIGEPIRRFVENNLQWVATVALALLIGGFAVLRWLA